MFHKGKEMKKFFFILGIVVLTAVIFAGGMFVGITMDIFKSMYTVSFVENEAIGAATTFRIVRMLDDNEIEQAKAHLNLTLDTKIITVGMFISECDNEKSKSMANSILVRIARHRQNHPASSTDKQSSDIIQGFLDKAIQEDQNMREKQN